MKQAVDGRSNLCPIAKVVTGPGHGIAMQCNVMWYNMASLACAGGNSGSWHPFSFSGASAGGPWNVSS